MGLLFRLFADRKFDQTGAKGAAQEEPD